jgi:hypothetical protein
MVERPPRRRQFFPQFPERAPPAAEALTAFLRALNEDYD